SLPPPSTTSSAYLPRGRSLNSKLPSASESQTPFLNSFLVVPPARPSLSTGFWSLSNLKGQLWRGPPGPWSAPSKVSLSGVASSSGSFFSSGFFSSTLSCGSSPGRNAPWPLASSQPLTLPSGTSALSTESPLSSLKEKLPSTSCQEPAGSLSVPGLSEARIGRTHL